MVTNGFPGLQTKFPRLNKKIYLVVYMKKGEHFVSKLTMTIPKHTVYILKWQQLIRDNSLNKRINMYVLSVKVRSLVTQHFLYLERLSFKKHIYDIKLSVNKHVNITSFPWFSQTLGIFLLFQDRFKIPGLFQVFHDRTNPAYHMQYAANHQHAVLTHWRHHQVRQSR